MSTNRHRKKQPKCFVLILNILDRKLSAEVQYQDQMTLLRRRATETQNAEEKKQIESAMSLLSKMHEAGIRSFDELEDLNKEAINTLGSFEGRRLEITTYYNKLIAAERIKGNETAAKQLEGQRDMEILQETKQYKDFFGKIQTLSINTFEATRKALLSMMQEAYNSGKLTYDQYKELIDKINNKPTPLIKAGEWNLYSEIPRGAAL